MIDDPEATAATEAPGPVPPVAPDAPVAPETLDEPDVSAGIGQPARSLGTSGSARPMPPEADDAPPTFDTNDAGSPFADRLGRGIDQAIIDSILSMEDATLSEAQIRAATNGKARQLVALSAALAMIDAADALRNNAMIASTFTGTAMAKYLETGEDQLMEAIAASKTMMADAVANYAAIGKATAACIAALAND